MSCGSLRTPPLGFLQDLVAVHRTLAQEREDENTDGTGEELAIVIHQRGRRVPWPPRYNTLLSKATTGCARLPPPVAPGAAARKL